MIDLKTHTSSISTKEYGFLRTGSVSCPPSSYPTYPGGAPVSLDIECFSEYSLASILIIASSESNRNRASDFVSCVFPVPEGPPKIKKCLSIYHYYNTTIFPLFVNLQNKNDANGRLELASPDRDKRIALDTALTASGCPTTSAASVL